MTVIDLLNSGKLHAKARAARPECVDAKGNIHANSERAKFVNWLSVMKNILGDDVKSWPEDQRAEYERRYVPSH